MIIIEKAGIADATLLTALAISIYKENYLYLWEEGGAEWYMHQYAYAKEKLVLELSDATIGYYILKVGVEPVGYLKLIFAGNLLGYDVTESFEIERIYLLDKMKGQGLGKKMLEFAENIAVEMGKKMLFLKAMDSSKDAIAFYLKMGFVIDSKFSLPMPTFSLMKEAFRGMVLLTKKC